MPKKPVRSVRPGPKRASSGAAGSRGSDALREANTAFLLHEDPTREKKATRTARAKNGSVPVFLVEDNRLLSHGITALLSEQGLKVIATARTGKDALNKVRRMEPHVMLLDASVSDADAVALVAAVRAAAPQVKVIVMDLLPAQQDVVAFVSAGVSGFILKDATIEEFVGTIRAVADGVHVLPRPVAGALFDHVAAQARAVSPRGARAAVRLTARERQVVALIARGAANARIAGQLRVAEHTVKSHVHNILEKLALRTRLEVAAYAHDRARKAGAA